MQRGRVLQRLATEDRAGHARDGLRAGDGMDAERHRRRPALHEMWESDTFRPVGPRESLLAGTPGDQTETIVHTMEHLQWSTSKIADLGEAPNLRKITFYDEGYGSVPYWSLVLPLTLLSAWLILAKPRKAKAATGSTP